MCIAQLPLLLVLSIYLHVGKVKNSVIFTTDGVYAENAGAIFCYVQGWTVCRKCRSNFLLCPGMDGMQKMQEQFSVTLLVVSLFLNLPGALT